MIFSFIFLLDFIRMRSAVPLPVKSPAMKEEKLIAELRYSSVRIILEPQLGIRPIRQVINCLLYTSDAADEL